jgi:hypothetical protein
VGQAVKKAGDFFVNKNAGESKFDWVLFIYKDLLKFYHHQ